MYKQPWLRSAFEKFLDWSAGLLGGGPLAARPQPACRPEVEQLEDRTLLAGGLTRGLALLQASRLTSWLAVLRGAPGAAAAPAGRGHADTAAGGDPLYVLDTNQDVVLPSGGTPINTFSGWSPMNLLAQVSGAAVTGYAWDFSAAPDAQGISGASTQNVRFSWAFFSTAARTDTVAVTETTSGGGRLTQDYTFEVTPYTSPAWSLPSSTPLAAGVITPDKLNGQDTQAAGPYATLGLADGSVQTGYSLPAYNPDVSPLGLTYNSAVAHPQPVFLVRYQLSPSQALPSSLSAQLTLTDSGGHTVYSGPAVYYSPSGLNPGDWVQMALPANAAGLATGRYAYQVQVAADYGTLTTTTYSGATTSVTGSTTPNSQTASPFGAGWSLADVARLYPVTGGVIVQNPDGSSLFFAGSGGSYSSPLGDFSTLFYNSGTGTYTRALPDGTQYLFNSSGQQTALVDRDGRTTSFAYNGSGQLTSVTDPNGQVNTLTYNGSGQVTAITDPASRSLQLGYSGGQLTTITDPGGGVWTYAYDGANDLTSLTDPGGSGNTTQLTVNGVGQATGVTLPDGSSESLTAARSQGLAPAGTGSASNPAPAVLVAAAAASFSDGDGNTQTTYLDGLGFGHPVSTTDGAGDTSLDYVNGLGQAWLTADPLGNRDRYTFDGKGNVSEVVYPDNSFAAYSYNSFAEPTSYRDPTGASYVYGYDSRGDLEGEGGPLGLVGYSYTYNTAGLVTGQTDALAHTWTYSYNTLGELTSETDPLNHTQSWSYDSAGDVTASTNQDGYQTTYSYDSLGDLTGETVPVNATTAAVYSFTYDTAGDLTSATVPLSYSNGTLLTATTSYAYDSQGQLTQETDPLGGVTSYSYDHAGNLVGVTNPLGNTLTYSYDTAARLVGVTTPLYLSGGTLVTATTTYAYNTANEVTAVTTPLGQTTDYSYTSQGWLASETDPLGNQLSYTYDAAGDVLTQTQQDTGGHSITYSYTYDALHRLSSVLNPVAPLTTYGYNAASELTSISGYNDGQGSVTYGYNAVGETTSQTDAAGDTYQYSYDGVGNLTQETDPLLHVTTFAYDQRNELTSETNALGGVTSFGYNLAGWQTSETDPAGNQTQYSYNGAGELVSETNPLGYQETFTYDPAGDLTGQTDFNGHTISYSYNLAGWQTGETWLNSQDQPIYTASYTYDNAGDLTGASDPNSAYSYSYNADSQLTQDTVTYPGLSSQPLVTLSYGYDGFGDRTSLSDSLGGQVSYTYNNNAQLTGESLSLSGTPEAALSFTYDSQDRLAGISRTAGMGSDTITSSYSYDSANRLLGITYTNATTSTQLASFTYTYNADSQVTGYTGPEGTSSYSYDKLGELTGVTGAQAASFSYDNNGNRTTSGYQTGTGNEVTNDGTYSYTYDKNGNLLTKTDAAGDVWNYTWDYRNRLTEVKETNSSQQTVLDEQFTYDVFNNLIGETVNGTPQRWTVFDGSTPYMDFSGTGQAGERYLADPNTADSFYGRVSTSGATDWYLTDIQGSVREIVGSGGAVEDALAYSVYGSLVSESNPSSGDRFKYAGGQYDSGLGLYNFAARWYNPADGGWISQDPLGFTAGDSNLYRYVGNGPTNATDLSGMDWVWPWNSQANWGDWRIFEAAGDLLPDDSPHEEYTLGGSMTVSYSRMPRSGVSDAAVISGYWSWMSANYNELIHGADDEEWQRRRQASLATAPAWLRNPNFGRRGVWPPPEGTPWWAWPIHQVQAFLELALLEGGIEGEGLPLAGAAPANTTIWNSITATQPVYEGTVIPRSFELTTANGRFWVHGNATEHLAEHALGAAGRGVSPELVNLGSQAQLTSLQAAVNAAAQQGIQYNTLMRVAGWELRFAPPRQAGQLPVITHALFTGG